ncbi:hypothetical protein GIB67_014184 [Kingdonia uniflora]|uniref:ELM2 domain-containing protein n=2 Tax=Kingdonia uniflora TaxID=39325 RepID=A0A7J7NC52_9MAGN|nr:hypothetical protein GIB67_014184 [Kingdonia uniflora]
MTVLRVRLLVNYKQEKHIGSTLLNVDKLSDPYFSRLKTEVFVDPFNPKASSHKIQPQTQLQKARKVLSQRKTEFLRGKCKRNQLLQELDNQRFTGLSVSSSIPCLIDYGDSDNSFDGILHNKESFIRSQNNVYQSLPSQADKLELIGSSSNNKAIIIILDSDNDSFSDSNFMTLKNSTFGRQGSFSIKDVYSINTSNIINPVKLTQLDNELSSLFKSDDSITPSRSTTCIKHHINEERKRLQSKLGRAFSIWRFDEMGEGVSDLWTHRQQESFSTLMKMNSGFETESFLKMAMQLFPCKSRENIVSYYFNVIILRRMRKQARLTYLAIDSDNDEVEERSRKSQKLACKYLI